MELFSEIYGCYFSVVSKILDEAQKGLSKNDIDAFVREEAFFDSAIHILPHLYSGNWDLFFESESKFFSKISNTKRPMTNLELSFLKSLLDDKRINLFVSSEEKNLLSEKLNLVPKLFDSSNFHIFDIALDGDDFEDKNYIENFRKILFAIKNRRLIKVNYLREGKEPIFLEYLPYKINYSQKDNKFRLESAFYKKDKFSKSTLNFNKIKFVEVLDKTFDVDISNIFEIKNETPIIIKIEKKRNAIERFMLQFASWEKETEYDEENNCYICKIFYNRQEETELLIRILSFGPVVKVLGPDYFLSQIKKRILNQFELNSK